MGVLIPFITVAFFVILLLIGVVFFFMVGSLYVEETMKKIFTKIFRRKKPETVKPE